MSAKSSENVNVSSPGVQLCKARERAGVSLQYIAEQTLIPILKLQALERDDYSAVGGTAHVTGYARAYGRVLGIDVNALVKEIELSLGVEQIRLNYDNGQGLPLVASKSPIVYVLIGAVVIILIALWVGLKIFSDSDSEKSSSTLPAASQQLQNVSSGDRNDSNITITETTSLADSNNLNPSELSNIEAAEERNAVSKDISAAAVSDENITSPVESGDLNSRPASLPSSVKPELKPVDSVTAVKPVEKAVEKPVETITRKANVDSAARDQLQLSFVDDCWLTVSDASGKTLISNLVIAGETLDVKGVAPFQVHLGNASAASKIALNQQPIAFSPQPGQRTLRLTVGG